LHKLNTINSLLIIIIGALTWLRRDEIKGKLSYLRKKEKSDKDLGPDNQEGKDRK